MRAKLHVPFNQAAEATMPGRDVRCLSVQRIRHIFNDGPAFVQNLAGLLAEEQLARWEDLELAQGLQRMTDCVFCPRCSSACLEDAENCAQCPKCFFVFCSLCNESWHPGIEVRACHDSLASTDAVL